VYIPQHFREDRSDVLHAFMEESSFATVITAASEGMFATHIPVLLDGSAGRSGTLRGHVAKANPHWQLMNGINETLVIFTGPHAYISPSWYASGGRVPTWNYVAVHAYGKAHVIKEGAALRRLVEETVHRYEDGFERPWHMSSLTEEQAAPLLSAIVGFEMPIERLEGKRKLGQNRSRADREAMVRGLRAYGRDDAAVIADLIEADLTG
jgi:transcriptional regulator